MSRRAASSRTKRALPDRITLWISEHGGLVAGSLIVTVATVFAVWVTMASLPFGDQREVVVHWFGGGAYLLAAVVAVFGVLTGIQRVRSTVRQDRRLIRQSSGVGLAALALWGIAGAITPDASLGGVSLARYGAGGQVGGWLDSPVGWGLILIGLVGAFVLIAPSAAQSLANAAGRGLEASLRYAGREIRDKGPGVLAAMARAAGRGFVALAVRDLGGDPLGWPRAAVGHWRDWRSVERVARRPTAATTSASSRCGKPTYSCAASGGGTGLAADGGVG